MRRIVVSMNITLDGFMSGPNCELDWHFDKWTEDMSECFSEQLSKADTVLLGRVTYNAMASYWQSKALDLSTSREDLVFASMLNAYKKVVFSSTLPHADWYNSRLVKRNIVKEIIKLKHQEGKDMIVYGSGVLVSFLMQSGFVDEYVLWVHPVILGRGKPFFRGLQNSQALKLSQTLKFSSGVIALYYEPAGN